MNRKKVLVVSCILALIAYGTTTTYLLFIPPKFENEIYVLARSVETLEPEEYVQLYLEDVHVNYLKVEWNSSASLYVVAILAIQGHTPKWERGWERIETNSSGVWEWALPDNFDSEIENPNWVLFAGDAAPVNYSDRNISMTLIVHFENVGASPLSVSTTITATN